MTPYVIHCLYNIWQLIYGLRKKIWSNETISIVFHFSIYLLFFNQAEFFYGFIKVAAVILFIILGIVINLGGAPDHKTTDLKHGQPLALYTTDLRTFLQCMLQNIDKEYYRRYLN
jgi:amino acid permease